MQTLDLIVCPNCHSKFIAEDENLRCIHCGMNVSLHEGKPVFTELQGEVGTFDLVERGPKKGTPWRQANWRFLEAEASRIAPEALILDVGSGHGDFAEIFSGKKYLALDVIPYPEVDVVCDLTQMVPFNSNTFDLITLMNVLEHVYPYHELLRVLALILRPGGKLLITVPFMVKIHQAPSDFHRFTHYALVRLAAEVGLNVDSIDGFYDPLSFMGEAISNLILRVFPKLKRPKRLIGRLLLLLVQGISLLIALVVGKGHVGIPEINSSAATGYHVILTKPL